jgi:hypothetical protein
MREIASIACNPPRTIREAFANEPDFQRLVARDATGELKLVIQENPEMLVSEFMEELGNAMEAIDPCSVVIITKPN